MIQFQISFAFCLLFYSIRAIDGGTCKGERSQQGFAHLNATYMSLFTSEYTTCVDLCLDDQDCLSLNFWRGPKKCDLNNLSRLSCTACYVVETKARYLRMARELGNLKCKIFWANLTFLVYFIDSFLWESKSSHCLQKLLLHKRYYVHVSFYTILDLYCKKLMFFKTENDLILT